MSFHREVIGVWDEPVEFPVTREHIIAYAEATNDPTPEHLEGSVAPPVYAVVPAFRTMANTTMAAVPDEWMMRILHGEHDFHIHRPIVPGDLLRCRAKVIGIHARSTGVVVSTMLETVDQDGVRVNDQYFAGFFRGAEATSEGETGPGHAFDESLREREPDLVAVQKYDEDQTFRYSEASGDPMPQHLSDEFAQSVGLPGIIVHGLCTMAFTSHALKNPQRLSRLAVRFSKPAQPKAHDHHLSLARRNRLRLRNCD
ncbi:MaoC family dehydratase N-terminal domain-containing protein [Kibdelosporangium philippinense]|uniref:MaoC family dehydratase N-terminal domain-containing protein n=1 Tax=Kibdelosporangium philippinense TaxID=211113 RepID=A0ABS8ZK15_9PSEU|nr:MaoC family dehydratase N-terminal domain-containing protein [Kibdelosporangium philippinense]MCE7008121.1 MaoC family dehydratase N-terminal domain-containing protein [Kibdelosporangium philippinense]